MRRYTIIKLKNLTPLHIGDGRENYDFSSTTLHSDTLSAAIASIRANEGYTDDVKAFLQSFVISSAFPFVGETLFFPKPQGKIDIHITDGEEYHSRKLIKKIRYLEYSLWSKVTHGERLEVESSQIKDVFLISADKVMVFEKPYASQVNQRVLVYRADNARAEPFFFEWNYFNPNAGLYCILDTQDDVRRNEIIKLFEKLGDIGLGTDRSVGGGKFNVESKDWAFEVANETNAQMLLSLYIPTKDELSGLCLQDSRYELLLRNGYMAGSSYPNYTHLRKKSIYAFNVGSIFRSTTIPCGKVVDLRPEWNDDKMHPVYRSGKPFVVSIKL